MSSEGREKVVARKKNNSHEFQRTIRSSSLMRSEFLLTNLNELATTGTSSLDKSEHFSASFVLEFPIFF